MYKYLYLQFYKNQFYFYFDFLNNQKYFVKVPIFHLKQLLASNYFQKYRNKKLLYLSFYTNFLLLKNKTLIENHKIYYMYLLYLFSSFFKFYNLLAHNYLQIYQLYL